jgi:membrane protease YdiL (CAAX protease family)
VTTGTIAATFAAYALVWVILLAAPASREIVRAQLGRLPSGLSSRLPAGAFAGALLVLTNVAGLLLLGAREYAGWRGPEPRALVLTLVYTLTVASTEELILRGVLLERVRRISTEMVAILVTALVFAVMHAGRRDFTMSAAVEYAVDGLVLGWAATRTGSIWFGVGWHWAKNLGVALAFGSSKNIMPPVLALAPVTDKGVGPADLLAYAAALPLTIGLIRAVSTRGPWVSPEEPAQQGPCRSRSQPPPPRR